MKRAILYLIFLSFNYFHGNSQEIIKGIVLEPVETIRQIQVQNEGEMLNIQTFQQFNFCAGNRSNIVQLGDCNNVLVVQMGSYNTFAAEQTGGNNYLVSLQKGNNNSMTGYRQQNYSEGMLYDQIVQIGNNLSFDAEGLSGARVTGNNVRQIGNNLSFEVNSLLPNTRGGIQVNQTGRDMRVVVEQSYFSFPLR